MEVKHIFNREILAQMNSNLDEIFVVKSGRLVLMDADENIIASFGPSSTCGLDEVMEDRKLDGNLFASGTTSVLAIGSDIIKSELSDVDDDTRSLLTGVQNMVDKHKKKK